MLIQIAMAFLAIGGLCLGMGIVLLIAAFVQWIVS
jgi:hypothetical protein